MAKKSRMSVLKRQREAKKAEKAALKRERREQRKVEIEPGGSEASREDMAAYFGEEEVEESAEESQGLSEGPG